MKQRHVVWILAALVVIGALIVLDYGVGKREITSDDAHDALATNDQGDGAPTLTSAARSRRAKDATADTEHRKGTWIVKGRVTYGWKTPAPGKTVLATAYKGFHATGDPILQATLVSGKDGRFAWPLEPPHEPMRLVFRSQDGSVEDDALALPNAPAPTSIAIHLTTSDAYVEGVVIDQNGQPIRGAAVLTSRRKAPIECNAEGTFRLAVSSHVEVSQFYAHAPGYGLRREVVNIPRPGATVRFEIKLRKEFRIRGIVTDPDGRPLQGAVVRTFMTHFHNRATTNAAGEYVLGHLDPGRPKHSIYARHPSYLEARGDVVTRGDEAQKNLQVKRGVRVEGRVVDEEGKPLEGASLYVGFGPNAYNRLDALAEQEGRFVFPVVATGKQTLVTSRPGFAPAKQILDVPAGESLLSDVIVIMTRGRAIMGRIVKSDGSPIAGVHISWKHEQNYIRESSITDSDGRFESHHLPTQSLSLEGYGTGISSFQHAFPDGTTTLTDVVLTAQEGGKLAGRVIDDHTDKPLARFRVRMIPGTPSTGEQRGGHYSSTWAREGHQFVDVDGYWDTGDENLAVGHVYGVEISAKGYAPARHSHIVARPDPDASALVIRLVRAARLVGTVVDERTGTPVGGAVIRLYSNDLPLRFYDNDDTLRRPMAHTDVRGRFSLANLGIGEMRAFVTHEEFAPLNTEPFELRAGEETALPKLSMTKGGTIEGHLTDASGHPIPNVAVEISRVVGKRRPTSQTWQAQTGPDGRYKIEGLPAGPLTVRRMRPPDKQGFSVPAEYSVLVALHDGESKTVSFKPRGSTTLRGTIIVDDPLPMGVWVYLNADPTSGLASRSTRVRNNAFVFNGVEAGRYHLGISHFVASSSGPARNISTNKMIEVRENGVQDVELEVKR